MRNPGLVYTQMYIITPCIEGKRTNQGYEGGFEKDGDQSVKGEHRTEVNEIKSFKNRIIK